MDGWTDGRMEIHPCVLWDIGPLGSLPKKVEVGRKEERMEERTKAGRREDEKRMLGCK